MTLLQFSDGRPFATGLTHYLDCPTTDPTRTTRIVIPIGIGDSQTEAVVDTGGVYLVCHPEIGDWEESLLGDSLGTDKLRIGQNEIKGKLFRVEITLAAEHGNSLALQVTALVPEWDPGETWPLPTFLGLQGCLEFLRFAIDPGANAFYFGPCDIPRR